MRLGRPDYHRPMHPAFTDAYLYVASAHRVRPGRLHTAIRGPNQTLAAMITYRPSRARPSSHVDSPSKTTSAPRIVASASDASSSGVRTSVNGVAPTTRLTRTSTGVSAIATWRLLLSTML